MDALPSALTERIRATVEVFVRRIAQPELAPDLIQEVTLSYLTNGFGQLVDHAVIDAMRKIVGDSRKKGKHTVNTHLASILELDDVPHSDDTGTKAGWLSQLKGLTQDERSTLVLTFEWGFTLSEIGHVFGITESAASFRLSRLLNRIRGQHEQV